MKRIWKLAGIALIVAVLGVGAASTVAYAQEDEAVHPFDFVSKFKDAIAGILGITVEQYEAAVEQAQSQVTDQALAEGWLTEDQAEKMKERFAEGPGAPGIWGRGMKRGPMGGPKGLGDSSLIGVAAEMLDMSTQDLRAVLQDGKSIADVATEKGVDVQAILDAYLAEVEADLAEAVAEGKITQNQAGWQLEQAGERGLEMLNGTFEGTFPGGFRGGRWPGGIKSAPGESDA